MAEQISDEQKLEATKESGIELSRIISVVSKDCIDSYFDFFVEFWDIVNQDELVLNWHIKAICDKMQEYGERVVRGEKTNDLIINQPPATSKSSLVSVFFQPWLWLHKPDCVIISSSNTSLLSIDHSSKAKSIVKSERYQLYFAQYIAKTHGKFLGITKDNERVWGNNYGGMRIITSTGGSITGKHAHIITRDDSMNPEEAESSAYRTRANRFNDRSLSSRKKDKEKAPTITVEQRLHVDDATGHDLAKPNKEIEHICLPAENTDIVKPAEWSQYYTDGFLDPVRLGRKALDEQKEDLGVYAYAGQYRQQPAPKEGGIIKREWFVIKTEHELPEELSYQPMRFIIDGAFTDKTTNDPTAQIAYRELNGKLYIFMCSAVRKELNEYLKFAKPWLMENQYTPASIVRVEMKASGAGFKSMLREEEYGGFNMGEVNNQHVSWGKITRAEYVGPTLESGKVILVKGNWNEPFIDQCANFPNDTHDDMLDVLCYSVLQEISRTKHNIIKTTVNLRGNPLH